MLQLETYGNAGRGFLQPFVNKIGGHRYEEKGISTGADRSNGAVSYTHLEQIYVTQDTHPEQYLQTKEGHHLPVAHCIEGTEDVYKR